MGTRIRVFDTTLRDGAQTQDVDFSVADKIAIAQDLDRLGVDYIEGGWPGANPTDDAFFGKDAPSLKRAKLVAFGMTRRPGRSADNDPGLRALLDSRADAICLVGKTWDFHVEVALGITPAENLRLIADSLAAARAAKGEALFDAEHFFDGYKRNPEFAVSCLGVALEAGADWLVLCDTNGGTLPHEIDATVRALIEKHGLPGDKLGIHCHNDTENAVANSIASVRAGARMVQGTLNGLGERCGNTNLVSLIPTLTLKMRDASGEPEYETGISPEGLASLPAISRSLDERLNRPPNRHAAYVGASAFAHKGGLHVSAVMRDPKCYEHVDPAAVGNRRAIVVSDQAGRSNILASLRDMGLNDIDPDDPRVPRLLDLVKQRDMRGWSYDTAAASFEVLVRRELGEIPSYFEVRQFRVIDEGSFDVDEERLSVVADARVTIQVGGVTHVCFADAEGNGPVHALDSAFRLALRGYEEIQEIKLSDFHVRILDSNTGTAARPRVLIRSVAPNGDEWSTLGVSTNIIKASAQALLDSYTYHLFKRGVKNKR